jgi:hypothetical protein
MSILDCFRTRKKLIRQRDLAWDQLDMTREVVMYCADNLGQAKHFVTGEMAKDPVRVLPGSDIGQGELIISSWGVKLLAAHFSNLLEKHGGPNFFTMTFVSPTRDDSLEITMRWGKGLTPAELLNKQIEKVKGMEKVEE